MTPATFREFLTALADAETLDPATGTGDLGVNAAGYLNRAIRDALAEELAGLPPDTLLIEASSTHLVRRQAVTAVNPTALQYLPGGTQLAALSGERDFDPSDPADPRWLLLPMVFLGRLQETGRDGLSELPAAASPVQIDPLLLISAAQQLPPGTALPGLALALANWGDAGPVEITIGTADRLRARSLARLDPVALEESWFRLHHPGPEPAGELLQSVLAATPDTPARLGRTLTLRRLVDPRRSAYPPDSGMPPPPVQAATDGLTWGEHSLLLPPTVHVDPGPQPPRVGWYLLPAHLSAGLLPPGAAPASRYPAASLLPATLKVAGTANPRPLSLAVSPYLGLQWRPAPADAALVTRVLLAELLCADPVTGDLQPVATHAWELRTAADRDSAHDLSLTWAGQIRARLAPDSPIGVLRYQEINDNTNPDSTTEAALTLQYSFVLAPDLPAPPALARKTFALRARPAELHHREGQYGGSVMPATIHDLELAPPQVVGVQPVYLTQTPAAGHEPQATAGWPWGLSALRVSVRFTEDGAGVAARAGAGTVLWWHAVQHSVQYRSALQADGPAAGLPRLFRATPIGNLLPVAATPTLPTLDSELFSGTETDRLDAWQPVLPGGVRYLLTGVRAGVPLALRHHLLRQAISAPGGGEPVAELILASGGLPVQHRMPRPVPLPDNQITDRDAALQPWASYFQPASNALVTPGPADEAFLAPTRDPATGAASGPARRLRAVLTEPARGEIDPNGDGTLAFVIDLEDTPVDGGWTVTGLDLVIGNQPVRYRGPVNGDQAAVAAPGTYRFTPQSTADLQRSLTTQAPGAPLLIRMAVQPATGGSGFTQTLAFPARLGGAGPRLPLEPRFIHFEDPEYNRRLATPSAQATAVVQLPAAGPAGTTVQRTVTLAADRGTCGPDTILAVRYDWDEPHDSSTQAPVTTLSLRHVNAERIAETLTLTAMPPTLEDGQLYSLPLAEMRRPDVDPAQFLPGDQLLLCPRRDLRRRWLADSAVDHPGDQHIRCPRHSGARSRVRPATRPDRARRETG